MVRTERPRTLAIWVGVALLVGWAYWKPGFKNAGRILEGYRAESAGRDVESASREKSHRKVG